MAKPSPLPLSSSAPVVKRPISPHLSIYQPQLTSGLSIFHKGTGFALFAGYFVLVAWLVCLAWLPDWYPLFIAVATSWIGRIFLIGWTWAFLFHMSVGTRYFFWAAGWGLSLKHVYFWGYLALAFSFIATIGLWALILGAVPL